MRDRHRADYFGSPVSCGDQFIDTVPPYGNGPWTWISEYTQPTYGRPRYEERTRDELHPGPPYRTGGPFTSWKLHTDEFVTKAPVDIINMLWRFTGSHLPAMSPRVHIGWSSFDDFVNHSGYDDVSDYGAAGWNRFRPTKSGADLGVFLGEIKEVPRMLRTTARGFKDIWKSMGGSPTGFGPKSVANHWLNTQFGWFPFLGELRDFYRSCANLDKALKQLRRDNGRWVRRGGVITGDVDSEVVYEQETSSGLWPSPSTSLFTGSPYGSGSTVRTVERKIWFEGAFRYWIPGKPGSLRWNANAVSLIFGLRPSPSLVWELTPWSWLIDWVSDVGDAIANLSSIHFDNLCAKYAYCMGHTTVKTVYTGKANYLTGPATASWSYSLDCKTRVEASPFGFGLTSLEFSTRQWSILAALGITRIR